MGPLAMYETIPHFLILSAASCSFIHAWNHGIDGKASPESALCLFALPLLVILAKGSKQQEAFPLALGGKSEELTPSNGRPQYQPKRPLRVCLEISAL